MSILVLVTLTSGHAAGLTIYRFGGDGRLQPPEAGQPGVEYVQLRWSDLNPAAGGQALELDMDGAIWPRQHDETENLVPRVRRRPQGEADPEVGAPDPSASALDGDPTTVWLLAGYECARYTDLVRSILCDDQGFSRRSRVNIDLRGRFLIKRIRLLSGLTDAFRVAESFRITLAPFGSEVVVRNSTAQGTRYSTPFWALPHNILVTDNTQQVRDVIIPEAHQQAIALSVSIGPHNLPWEISEIEVYARGVVDTATYVSSILDMGGTAVWGDARWSGKVETGAEVFLQTRTGLDDDPTVFWRYTGRVDEKVQVSRADYDQLQVGERAGTSYDRNGWTFWSAPYDFADSSGTPVVSRSPRRFLQFRADFVSDGEASGRLDHLELRASRPPAATRLVAEIWPDRAAVGQTTRFTYAMLPTIVGDDTGFDTLELTTSALVGEVSAVRTGGIDVAHTLEAKHDGGFTVRFLRLDTRHSGALLEVDFVGQVLRTESAFEGRVCDSLRPLEVTQPIFAGNATGDFESNRVSVQTSIRPDPVLDVRVGHGIITPNGDGVRDNLDIAYSLFEVTTPVPVAMEISDLGGRVRRRLVDRPSSIGHHRLSWDGRDQAGRLVAPGVYMLHASVQADTGPIERIVTIHVVY